jgi:hypothetical protein
MPDQDRTKAMPNHGTAIAEAMRASMQLPIFQVPTLMQFALPLPFRALAENGVTQGKEALETMGRAAETTYSENLKGLDECGVRIMEAGINNAQAAFDCCHELVTAKTQSELLDVWSTHARRQFDALFTQNKEIWELALKVADQQNPIVAGMTRMFARPV